jgi:SanA protein
MVIASVFLLTGGVAFPFWWSDWVARTYAPVIHPLHQAPPIRVALVLGARVYPNGRLSAMLADRVDTAVALYKAGKVDKLLMSGDNSHADYDEPGAMMAYAIQRGVPAEDIQPDYGGRRTYDSCYRARQIFHVDEAVIVTQAFHLPRALFLCENLGLQVEGVMADRRSYSPRSLAWSEMREKPAMVAALLDVIRRAPPPVMGAPIPLQ